jgi:hypothetical protein
MNRWWPFTTSTLLMVRPNELDALNPVVARRLTGNREIVGLPRNLGDVREESRGVGPRSI